jgi:hypothetical protein
VRNSSGYTKNKRRRSRKNEQAEIWRYVIPLLIVPGVKT